MEIAEPGHIQGFPIEAQRLKIPQAMARPPSFGKGGGPALPPGHKGVKPIISDPGKSLEC